MHSTDHEKTYKSNKYERKSKKVIPRKDEVDLTPEEPNLNWDWHSPLRKYRLRHSRWQRQYKSNKPKQKRLTQVEWLIKMLMQNPDQIIWQSRSAKKSIKEALGRVEYERLFGSYLNKK